MKKNLRLLVLVTAILFLPQVGRSAELLTNGSFETGNMTGWTIQSTQTTDWCTNWIAVTSLGGCNDFTSPQHGIYDALNGFDGTGGEMRLWQDVAIPTGVSARLTFKYKIIYDMVPYGATLPRFFHVQIRDTSNNVLQTVDTFIANPLTTQDTGWITKQMFISQYAGQTIRLYFLEIIPETYTGPGHLELDDVRLETFPPTAAAVSIGGQVRVENGYGIGGTVVSFTDSSGQLRTTRTNPFGYYTFDNVEVGNTYVIEAGHKQHVFPNSPIVFTLNDGRKDLNFIAAPSLTQPENRLEPKRE